MFKCSGQKHYIQVCYYDMDYKHCYIYRFSLWMKNDNKKLSTIIILLIWQLRCDMCTIIHHSSISYVVFLWCVCFLSNQ